MLNQNSILELEIMERVSRVHQIDEDAMMQRISAKERVERLRQLDDRLATLVAKSDAEKDKRPPQRLSRKIQFPYTK